MEKFAAAFGLLVCALMVLRLAVGPAHRQRFDTACRRLYQQAGAHWASLRRRTQGARAADPDAARREADQLIERARQRRQDADHDGNVIRPRAFDPSKKKPPLH